jgi:hypothetical protein
MQQTVVEIFYSRIELIRLRGTLGGIPPRQCLALVPIPYPSSHHRGVAHRGYPDFQAIAKDIFKTMLQIANRRVLIAKPWAHFCSNVLASSAQRSNHQSP